MFSDISILWNWNTVSNQKHTVTLCFVLFCFICIINETNENSMQISSMNCLGFYKIIVSNITTYIFLEAKSNLS